MVGEGYKRNSLKNKQHTNRSQRWGGGWLSVFTAKYQIFKSVEDRAPRKESLPFKKHLERRLKQTVEAYTEKTILGTAFRVRLGVRETQ